MMPFTSPSRIQYKHDNVQDSLILEPICEPVFRESMRVIPVPRRTTFSHNRYTKGSNYEVTILVTRGDEYPKRSYEKKTHPTYEVRTKRVTVNQISLLSHHSIYRPLSLSKFLKTVIFDVNLMSFASFSHNIGIFKKACQPLVLVTEGQLFQSKSHFLQHGHHRY
jgi:hypothetical protein